LLSADRPNSRTGKIEHNASRLSHQKVAGRCAIFDRNFELVCRWIKTPLRQGGSLRRKNSHLSRHNPDRSNGSAQQPLHT
jgi:hypothetical protein